MGWVKTTMSTRTVSTKEQLKRAKADKVSEIIVTGKLAKDLKAAKKITTLGVTAMGILTAAIATIPVTGGISGIAGVAAVATTTGVSIPAIILTASLGIGFIVAVFKDYSEIEFDASKPALRLKKK